MDRGLLGEQGMWGGQRTVGWTGNVGWTGDCRVDRQLSGARLCASSEISLASKFVLTLQKFFR